MCMYSHVLIVFSIVSYPDPPTKNRERVWTNVHKHRVPEELCMRAPHCTVRANQVQINTSCLRRVRDCIQYTQCSYIIAWSLKLTFRSTLDY